MFVNHDPAFIYLAPPKTGTGSVSRQLRRLFPQIEEQFVGKTIHTIPDEYDWPNYFTWITVRHPFSRAVSWWAYVYRDSPTRPDFCEWIVRVVAGDTDIGSAITYTNSAQSYFINRVPRLDRFIKQEHLSSQLDTLPFIPTGTSKRLQRIHQRQGRTPWQNFYNPEAEAVVRELWGDDLQLLEELNLYDPVLEGARPVPPKKTKSPAPLQRSPRAPTHSVNTPLRYHLIDLGAKNGGSIAMIRENLARPDFHHKFFGMQNMPRNQCLGVDRHPDQLAVLKSKGYGTRDLDLNVGFPDEPSELYSAFNILEHNSSIGRSQELLEMMLSYSTKGVWLRLPSFEQDTKTGEGVLKELGLRWKWTTWQHHQSHFCLEHVKQVLVDHSSAWECVVKPVSRMHDTSHPSIVPLAYEDEHTGDYDESMGPKEFTLFKTSIIPEWDVFIRPRPKSLERKARSLQGRQRLSGKLKKPCKKCGRKKGTNDARA